MELNHSLTLTPLVVFSELLDNAKLPANSLSRVGFTTRLELLGFFIFLPSFLPFEASKGWGPLLLAQLVWFLMESPNLWILLLFWSNDNSPT